VYRNGGGTVRAELASCYRKSLELAEQHNIQSIAFPGISTGVYGYPQREAADIAIATVSDWLSQHAVPAKVILCTYDTLATMIMTEAMKAAEAG
jgi:O-acetyl-ADP-ribose deacetylase (regulator of RNase III)